jgi:hypothetical protein
LTDATTMLPSSSERSALSAFVTRSFSCASVTFTAVACRLDTTWSRFRTDFTPSIFFASPSALAVSSAEVTLPCSVTFPSTVSTLMALLLMSFVVKSVIFVLMVIHASETPVAA